LFYFAEVSVSEGAVRENLKISKIFGFSSFSIKDPVCLYKYGIKENQRINPLKILLEIFL